MKIKLSKEVMLRGKKCKEVTLNFESLTGAWILEAEKQARALGNESPFPLTTLQGSAVMAAKMMGIPFDDMTGWNAKDFTEVAGAVMAFFMKPVP